MALRRSLLLHALLACSSAFRAPLARAPSGIPLHAKDAKPKKGAGISPNLKAKLLQEAESPWRTVRKFIYGAFALSATVGGLTALTQLAAYQQPDAFPLEKSLQNVLVDFSVVAACAYGAKVDGAADADLEEEDDAAPPPSIDDEAIATNLACLQKLRVTFAGECVADVETLRTAANQAVVVVAGPAAVVDDALRDALIEQKTLASSSVIVIPVRTSAVDAVEAAMGRRSDSYGFVALPVDDAAWAAYAEAECAVAAGQGAATAAADGIVIAVRSDGTVARRGLGKPVWKMVVEDLAPPKKEEAGRVLTLEEMAEMQEGK